MSPEDRPHERPPVACLECQALGCCAVHFAEGWRETPDAGSHSPPPAPQPPGRQTEIHPSVNYSETFSGAIGSSAPTDSLKAAPPVVWDAPAWPDDTPPDPPPRPRPRKGKAAPLPGPDAIRGPWGLHLGESLPWLESLPDQCLDHLITDPPYSAHVHANARSHVRKEPLPDKKTGILYPARKRMGISRGVDFGFSSLDPTTIGPLSAQFARLTRRWVMVFSDVESCHLWRLGLEAAGLDYVRTLCWHKLGGAPSFTGDRPAAAFETITLAHKPKKKRWNGGGKQGFYNTAIELNRGGVETRFHTTAKPAGLMVELLADFTDAGELVGDPFAGSATTGAAALRLGRRFLGCERDATIHAQAVERLEAEARSTTLGAKRLGQEALFK